MKYCLFERKLIWQNTYIYAQIVIKILSENSRKGCRNDTLTIEELFEKIIKYDKDYSRQDDCLYYISCYLEGDRWCRPDTYEDHFRYLLNKRRKQ